MNFSGFRSPDHIARNLHIIANFNRLFTGPTTVPGFHMKRHCMIGLAAACALAAPSASIGQSERLPLLDPAPLPRDGVYRAGDNLEFSLDHSGQWVRLRFSGSDEIFYLSAEAAPLGVRVMKYDTGEPALRVTGWGGVTLYTPQDKTGIPVEYEDAAGKLDPPTVAPGDAKRFAAGLAREVDARTDFAIGFAADWDELARSDTLRGLACEAMRNASYALEQSANGRARNTISDGLHVVRVVSGNRASAAVRRGVLTITIAPALGPAARPSSLEVSRTLATAFLSP